MCPQDVTLASYYPSGNIETPALIPHTLQGVPSSMRHLRHVGVLAAYAVKVTVQTATRAQEQDFATVPRRAPIKLEPRRASGYPAARAIARTLNYRTDRQAVPAAQTIARRCLSPSVRSSRRDSSRTAAARVGRPRRRGRGPHSPAAFSRPPSPPASGISCVASRVSRLAPPGRAAKPVPVTHARTPHTYALMR